MTFFSMWPILNSFEIFKEIKNIAYFLQIDNLTNWYVRTNRKRIKGENTTSEDCRAALDTLFSVVYTM